MQKNDKELSLEDHAYAWRLIGFIILSIRFVQGWIFWGGGSRRFFYAPQKLDPHDAEWMANKFQAAMPGAMLGISHVINFLLHHFYLLYIAIVIYSLIELLCGLALLFGFFTRLAAAITVLLSTMLMLIFGWEGATCLDEWTMAICNISMGFTLLLSGAFVYSIDHFLIRHKPQFTRKRWFRMLASGSISFNKIKWASIFCFIFTAIFALTTYNYLRGAIFTRFHVGPVSPIVYQLLISNGVVKADGTVQFMVNIDAGNPSVPTYIIRIELLDAANKIIETWEGRDLSFLPKANISNEYRYNRVFTGRFGLVAPVSAKAQITLPPNSELKLGPGQYTLSVFTIDGHQWKTELQWR